MKLISALLALVGVVTTTKVVVQDFHQKRSIALLYEYTFDDFLFEFRKSYPDSKEFELRKSLFETRLAGFVNHNQDNHSYKVTPLTPLAPLALITPLTPHASRLSRL
jgi:hypothetical protein